VSTHYRRLRAVSLRPASAIVRAVAMV